VTGSEYTHVKATTTFKSLAPSLLVKKHLAKTVTNLKSLVLCLLVQNHLLDTKFCQQSIGQPFFLSFILWVSQPNVSRPNGFRLKCLAPHFYSTGQCCSVFSWFFSIFCLKKSGFFLGIFFRYLRFIYMGEVCCKIACENADENDCLGTSLTTN
jgi:hypothetical protein